ncbi:MAG: sensor domain-containing diguanylate cyclase [Chloroflexaceae bacterium]|jgi:diguanylate cyclase (GGDEF)-like protein|nr:sensor domain-containing diguanylate cyclase [Chloroflexaceae bacterium]
MTPRQRVRLFLGLTAVAWSLIIGGVLGSFIVSDLFASLSFTEAAWSVASSATVWLLFVVSLVMSMFWALLVMVLIERVVQNRLRAFQGMLATVIPGGSRAASAAVRSHDEIEQLTIIMRGTIETLSHTRQFERNRNQVLELIAASEPLERVLHALALLVQQQRSDSYCAVSLFREGHLFLAAAPHLPQALAHLLDGVAVGADGGTAAYAAHRHRPAYTCDLVQDQAWASMRPVALQQGVRACWSLPLLSHEGELLGTLDCYLSRPLEPTESDQELLESAASLARIAIQRQRLADQLVYQSSHDALTGLPNRALFEDRLRQALAQARRDQRNLALLYIDLDRFKEVNDTLGHHMGDALLCEVAQRMQGCLREEDTLARMGGDEFTVVLRSGHDAEEVASVAQRILHQLELPFTIDGQAMHISASIGISIYPQDGNDATTLKTNADNAMYHAKHSGKNGYAFFTPEGEPVLGIEHFRGPGNGN